MEKIFIKPAKPGLIVIDPDTGKQLDAGGEYKPRTPHWIRRLSGGDVIVATPPVKTNASAGAAMSPENSTTAKKEKVNKL